MTSPVPATIPMPRPQGRDAVQTFKNNINNIDASDYIWVKNFANYTLCHKSTGQVQPTQALIWIVGDIDNHNLNNAQPYGAWTVNIRLSIATNKALTALLKSGPYKTYNAPNRYSILRVKASLKSVLEDLEGEEEYLEAPAEPICAEDPYPFTYNGSLLTDGGSMPTCRYDIGNFDDHTSVAVEVSVLGYQMNDKEPGFSFGMQGIYHLGTIAENSPSTPGKRKGGCIVSPRRQKGAAFVADPSKPALGS